MPDNRRQVFVIFMAMLIGAATATALRAPGTERLASWPFAVGIALVCWVRTLALYSQGVERENPFELASWASMSVGMSCTAAASLLWFPTGSRVWSGWSIVMGAGLLLVLAGVGFRLRAITRKYENKRKAQSA